MTVIHAVIRHLSGKYGCTACPFNTDDLTKVAEHVVKNQFRA